MKKSILAILLALVMVASLLPFGALADDGTVGAEHTTPTGSGNYFFANGVPIDITASAPTVGSPVELEGFDATGSSAYISWTVNGATSYVGVSENTQVFGGADGRTKAVTVASTSINMTGGTIYRLFGGNYGEEEAGTDLCSEVTDDVYISLSGSAKVTSIIYGAGARNTCVNGTVTINLDGVVLNGNESYVNGGSWGNGKEGTRNIESGKMVTNAVANEVIITANNSTMTVCGAGGSGSTKVNSATVKMTNCKVEVFFVGGINGELKNCDIELVDCEIGSFAGTNRGFVGTADVDFVNCNIESFETGASNGCFSSDSGTHDGSGVTGSVTYNIDADSTVEDAALTPLVVRDTNDDTTASIGNITLNKAGKPIELKVNSFVTVYSGNTAEQTVNEFIVPDGSTVNLRGANVEVTAGQTLSNMGIITLDSDKAITIAEGATFNDGGTTNATVVGDGSIHKYVAKVDNVGYESLDAAMNAVLTNGGELYVLQDCELDAAQYSITNNVTIIGGGHKVEVTVAAGEGTIAFDIKNGVEFVLDDVNMTINGTENPDLTKNNDGTAIGIGEESNFSVINNGVLTLKDLNRGIVVGGGETALFVIDDSEFYVNNIDGNLSNGGKATFYYSTAVIRNVGNYGLSVNSLSLNNSSVSLDNVAYSAIFSNSGDIDLNKSNINITNCGSGLPYESNYTAADYVIDYNDKLTGMNVTVDANSSLRLTGNKNNSVNVGEGTFRSAGTFVGNVVVDPETTCVVTVEYNGIFTVEKNSQYTLPAAPSKSGYAFLGWSDGTTTYDARATVTITKNTTFTAVWVRHPDTPYVPEPEQPEQPETPVFPFYDVPTSAWYYTAVKYVYENKLMDGVDTYVFAPNDTLTRAMVWTIIARMSGVDTTGGNTWYAKAQEWVITNGISDGENPTAAITREQLVTMLYRYAQIKGYDVSVGENTNILSYVDATSISEYAMSAFQWACGSGLTEGDENGALTPLATATRAQAAAMIMRFCQSVK